MISAKKITLNPLRLPSGIWKLPLEMAQVRYPCQALSYQDSARLSRMSAEFTETLLARLRDQNFSVFTPDFCKNWSFGPRHRREGYKIISDTLFILLENAWQAVGRRAIMERSRISLDDFFGQPLEVVLEATEDVLSGLYPPEIDVTIDWSLENRLLAIEVQNNAPLTNLDRQRFEERQKQPSPPTDNYRDANPSHKNYRTNTAVTVLGVLFAGHGVGLRSMRYSGWEVDIGPGLNQNQTLAIARHSIEPTNI